MQLLNKLPNHKPVPHGLEWKLLKRMPLLALAATMIPLIVWAWGTWLIDAEGTADAVKQIQMVKIFAIALAVTGWTAVFTLAIGCVVVWVMKGPAYVADAYDLTDDEPMHRRTMSVIAEKTKAFDEDCRRDPKL